MGAKKFIVVIAALLLVAGGAYLAWHMTSSGDADKPDDGRGAAAGQYTLDRESYREQVFGKARDWAVKNGDGLGEEALAKLLERELKKASAAVAAAQVELELRADGTFTLHAANGAVESTASGAWTIEDGTITLDTQEIEGYSEEGPSPSLQMRVAPDGLIVQPSAGVPFEHRLVRKSAKATPGTNG